MPRALPSQSKRCSRHREEAGVRPGKRQTPERLVGLKLMDRRPAALAAAVNRSQAAECRAAAQRAMGLATTRRHGRDHGAADRDGLMGDRAVVLRSKVVAERPADHRARMVAAVGPAMVSRLHARIVGGESAHPQKAAMGEVLKRPSPRALRHRAPMVAAGSVHPLPVAATDAAPGQDSLAESRPDRTVAGQLARTAGRKRAGRRRVIKKTVLAA